MSIHKCTCKNEYQDKRYGQGMRVMNKCGSQTNVEYRCTVCATVKGSGYSPKGKKK